jgi:alpha-1,3-glucosyltransferase
MLLASLLLKPDLISIDHGHFQYNSLIVGLILGAFYCLLNRNHYTCCLLFTIAIHSKQMAVYYALAFFAGLIGNVMRDYRGNRAKIVGEIVKFGFIVLIVSLIIWLPFIVTGSAHLVLEAIFPVHRGLYQLKVQNFWCISDVFMKW